jgi:hypothetical protein
MEKEASMYRQGDVLIIPGRISRKSSDAIEREDSRLMAASTSGPAQPAHAAFLSRPAADGCEL